MLGRAVRGSLLLVKMRRHPTPCCFLVPWRSTRMRVRLTALMQGTRPSRVHNMFTAFVFCSRHWFHAGRLTLLLEGPKQAKPYLQTALALSPCSADIRAYCVLGDVAADQPWLTEAWDSLFYQRFVKVVWMARASYSQSIAEYGKRRWFA